MSTIDRTAASDAEFRARVARFDAAPVPPEVVVAGVQRTQLAEALVRVLPMMHASLRVQVAQEWADVFLAEGGPVQALIADAEKRAAASALRAVAHRLDDGGDEAIEVALGGAAYVHRVLCDTAYALAGPS